MDLLFPPVGLLFPRLTQRRGQKNLGWGTPIFLICGGEQVGNWGGDGLDGGLEEGWEAHQGDVVGEGWQGVALGEDLDRRSGWLPLGEGVGDEAG